TSPSSISSSSMCILAITLSPRTENWPPKSSLAGRVRERRGRLAADDRRGLVDELVVLESLHHEQGKVHAAREVALEDRVAHMPAPHGQALTLALLEVATAHDGPPRVAREHAPARLHLVVEVGEASEPRERATDLHERLELPRIHVLAVEGDVPPAREHEARPRRRVVEHRLGHARRVAVDPSRDQHDEHPVAPGDRPLDDLGVVRRSPNDSDAPLEPIELPYAFLTTHANHLVAPIQRVLDHVLPELPRGPDDANPHRVRPVAPWTWREPYVSWTIAFIGLSCSGCGRCRPSARRAHRCGGRRSMVDSSGQPGAGADSTGATRWSGNIPEHSRIRACASTASDACHQPIEPPLAGDASQLVFAGIRVPEAGADGEILDCLRHEHVARTRTRRHTCADRDGDPSDLRVDELHFA